MIGGFPVRALVSTSPVTKPPHRGLLEALSADFGPTRTLGEPLFPSQAHPTKTRKSTGHWASWSPFSQFRTHMNCRRAEIGSCKSSVSLVSSLRGRLELQVQCHYRLKMLCISRNFRFGRPDQNPFTPTPPPNDQISSSHVVPLPTPVSWGRAQRETDWGRCFQGISQTPLHTCAVSSPCGLRCTRRASACRHRQRPDPPQHLAEKPPVQMTFRQQEPVVPGMLHQPASSFHQPLLETGERLSRAEQN